MFAYYDQTTGIIETTNLYVLLLK